MRHARLSLPLCALAAVFTAAPAVSQEAPVVVLQYWKCDVLAMGELRESSETTWIPLAQELVEEGKFDFVQMLESTFSDEWSVIYYFRSPDRATYFAAWDEWVARINERFPDEATRWFERCPDVKHSMFRSTVRTALPSP